MCEPERMRSARCSSQRRAHAVRREREVAQAHADGVEDGVRDRRGGRALRRLAARRGTARPGRSMQHGLDLGHLREAQDRIAVPVERW